jgi:hypothetical protein
MSANSNRETELHLFGATQRAGEEINVHELFTIGRPAALDCTAIDIVKDWEGED